MSLARAKREQKQRNIRQAKTYCIYLHRARAPQSGLLKGCVWWQSALIPTQSSSSSSFPITCIGSSERTREYHPPRGAVCVAVSSISPGEVSFIGGASGALRPDVAYSVTRKTMCAYRRNAMLYVFLSQPQAGDGPRGEREGTSDESRT